MSLLNEQQIPMLSRTEAEDVASGLLDVWMGMTGLKEKPSIELTADMVQRIWRKGSEKIVGRSNG